MSDYTTMITDIINWTNHDEITTANAQSLIRYAEKKVYRKARVRSMESTLSVTISGGAAVLPSDFIAMKTARISGSPDQPLGIIDDEQMYRRYPTRSSESKPLFCAVEGGNLIFGPYPDSGYTVKGIYYARLTALSGSNTTNFFTGDGADALFFRALAEAEPFLRNDQRIPIWEAKAEMALREINMEYKKGRFAGPLRTKEA
jgi:hypothetical protein